MHPAINNLLKCTDLEEKEQASRYRLDAIHSLRQLKAEGLALHPLIVTRKNFGYADYPEISFRLGFPPENNLFRDGAAIECFKSGEEPVKGVLLGLDGMQGEFRLFSPDFPDWLEEDGVGIKLAPDTRTTGIIKNTLQSLEKNKPLFRLFEQLHSDLPISAPPVSTSGTKSTSSINPLLNNSQQAAVQGILDNERICIVHGPPGTGKTTTLIEAIRHLVHRGEKILVSAPSNTAVDHIASGLIRLGIRLLRVGNSSKAGEELYPYTPEGRLSSSKAQKEIKQLRIRAEEFRRMALKYKRSFGKAEREQRNLLFKEVRNIREEIRKLQTYEEEKLLTDAQVVAGTPIGLYDAGLQHHTFSTLVMDEAGQCIEPLAWCVFPLAEKIILAGDHWQLPPTVLSMEAAQLGLNKSILETAIQQIPEVYLLDTQYRMREPIAGFSSQYFYKGLLKTASSLSDAGGELVFIDTAGTGYQEVHGPDGVSLQNEGELQLIRQLIEQESIPLAKTALISPYAGQVTAARNSLDKQLRISTIDSFQGQEKEIILLSLVRSNDEGEIGFLRDYRRMNVAITRAKEKLIVIGDSATIAKDPFYHAFISYVEAKGNYRTAWEFLV